MGIVFNANEVLEMARQIERNGAAFYRKAAEIVQDSKDLLLEIAEQEDEHLATFTEMQENISAREYESTAYDPDDEGLMYLQAMANGHIFDTKKKPEDMLTGNENLADVMLMAIGAEKDSIVFYSGLKGFVPEKLGADKLDSIIKE